MRREEIKDKLFQMVDTDMPELADTKVDSTADFVEEYGVNSIQLIQLIVDAEDAFGVSFDDRELALPKYHSFDDLIDKIESKMKA